MRIGESAIPYRHRAAMQFSLHASVNGDCALNHKNNLALRVSIKFDGFGSVVGYCKLLLLLLHLVLHFERDCPLRLGCGDELIRPAPWRAHDFQEVAVQ